MHILIPVNIAIGLFVFVLLMWAAYQSKQEGETKAFKIFCSAVAIWILCSMLFSFVLLHNPELYVWFLPVIFILALILFIIPYKRKEISTEYPRTRIDERDTMFSRAELAPGSEKYLQYYKSRPEKLAIDNAFRKLPGLLSKNSLFYNTDIFNKAIENFEAIKLLYPLVEQKKSVSKRTLKEQVEFEIINKAYQKGAHSIGFTKIVPYHLYSIKGRGDTYGKTIESELPYAIAFTVEMDFKSMKHAPKAPVVYESSKQYLNAAKIAIEIAEMLRNGGYEARAHIDGNYNLICPLVAQDAGLGLIGRMGLLMTPKLGPRVRIGVVTTNYKLPLSKNKQDSTVLDFCERCEICAASCPSKAIPFGNRASQNETKRWQINQEKCYTYWCKAGTDCGLCMSRCPYSHPNKTLHNITRYGIRKSPVFSRLALWLEKKVYA